MLTVICYWNSYQEDLESLNSCCDQLYTSKRWQQYVLADTVSSDYLTYMLWQFPTNVTGWICSTLVTSSLLKVAAVLSGTQSFIHVQKLYVHA